MRCRAVLVSIVVLLAAGAALAAGTVEEVTFYSDALGREMPAQVYLPDGYDTSGIAYPVVYFVHGMSHDHLDYPEIIDVAEQMISTGGLQPFILVKPEAGCTPFVDAGFPVAVHSGLTNSALTGDFEDYFVEDLVAWVDATYRTIADREHRFVTGHSWGGYSSVRVGLRHSDVFGKVAAHAGALSWEPGAMLFPVAIAMEYPDGPPYDLRPDVGLLSVCLFAAAASFSPDLTNPPFYVDLAIDEWGELTPAFDSWLANSNTVWAAALADAGWDVDLYFDCGTRDDLLADYLTQYFSGALQSLGVPFTERWFDGDHWDHIAERLAVQYTFFMPLEATASSWRVFNPRRPWPQEVVVELPGDLGAELIDHDTIAVTAIDGIELESPVQPTGGGVLGDVNGNDKQDLTVWFPAVPLAEAMHWAGVDAPGWVEITLRGETTDDLFWEAAEELFVPTTRTALTPHPASTD